MYAIRSYYVHRTGVAGILELPVGSDRQAGPEIRRLRILRCVGRSRGRDPAQRDGPLEGRQDRRHEVLRLDCDPLERAGFGDA